MSMAEAQEHHRKEVIFYLQMCWHIEGRRYSFMEVEVAALRHHAESLTGDEK